MYNTTEANREHCYHFCPMAKKVIDISKKTVIQMTSTNFIYKTPKNTYLTISGLNYFICKNVSSIVIYCDYYKIASYYVKHGRN